MNERKTHPAPTGHDTKKNQADNYYPEQPIRNQGVYLGKASNRTTQRHTKPASIDKQTIQAIRERVDIAALIGGYVELRKSGPNYSGLCPFHEEKTPSFTVSETKGFYHCFGCGAHGDVIGFLMEYRGIGFPVAVRELAGIAGIQIESAKPGKLSDYKRRKYLELLEEERLLLAIAAEHEGLTSDDIQRAAKAAERIAKVKEVLKHDA